MLTALLLSVSLTANATELKTGIGTVDAENGLRLREKATTSAPVICVAQDGDQVVIIRKTGDWYLVNYNLNIGYMHADYVDVKEKADVDLGKGSLDPWLTNFRSGNSTETSIIGRIAAGEKVDVLGLDEGWYRIRYSGKEGFIRSDLITLLEKPENNHGFAAAPEARESSNSGNNNTGSSLGQEIATYAQSFVGYP